MINREDCKKIQRLLKEIEEHQRVLQFLEKPLVTHIPVEFISAKSAGDYISDSITVEGIRDLIVASVKQKHQLEITTAKIKLKELGVTINDCCY